VAATSTVLARAVRVPAGEAFNVGLLHDLGSSLLERLEPEGVRRASDLVLGGRSLPDAEHEVFGTTHAEVGAAALEAWRFPAAIVRAVAAHHGAADRRTDTLSKLLVAGEALAADIEPGLGDAPEELVPALEALGLSMDHYRRLRTEAEREMDNVVRFVTGGVR
jgi:putative nucleotidyltransferase with HDIG domain